ncbi:conserved hypothetical protein [delta proteobacterium NaphS2]|nr:conserved hypothetical protein [delta proteobacterium NaphS2]
MDCHIHPKWIGAVSHQNGYSSPAQLIHFIASPTARGYRFLLH